MTVIIRKIGFALFRLVVKCALTLVLGVALCSPSLALTIGSPQQQARIEGAVTDQTGAPVAGAEVTLSNGALSAKAITDGGGKFVLESTGSSGGTLRVRARGFRNFQQDWSAKDKTAIEITLEPEPFQEEITVTAERTLTQVSDTAASVVLFSREEISATAALTLDDALRQVPGFSLFRRSGSRTANPTSQGVSLRGVGASGASRAVVLADGIPINDPFGGWIYWGRVPRQSVERVEVVRGGGSHLYGTDALGGVINFIGHDPKDAAMLFEASYGNQHTPNVSMYVGGRFAQIGAQLSVEAFNTDGYRIVDERDRGAVDVPAGSERTTYDLTLERLFDDGGRVFLRGSLFGEERENGTPLQQNRTHIRQFAIGADRQSDRIGTLSGRAYISTQVFDQDFTAVAANRNSETLTRSQRVPAQQTGFTSQWSRGAGARQTLVAGLDAREVRGASDELVFVAGNLTSAIGAGGRERTVGAFGQDLIRITQRWLLTVGVRVDRWRNYDAHSTSRPLVTPGPTSVTSFVDRDETALSPRLSVLYSPADNVSLFASGYRAFRAPTLNELYRSFRVGSVVTQANTNLKAERLTGGEGGASVSALDRKINARGTFFWSEIARPIANITLSVTPDLITRRRQNLGRTRSRGVELEAEAHLTRLLALSSSYQFVDATVVEFPASQALEGLLIPQVPRHQLTFQMRYSNPTLATVGVQGRLVGAQFDDDQNQLQLDRYFTLDALVSRPVGHGVELFAAAENLLDRRYTIGRTPVRTVGPPLLARFGIRVRLGSK
jgi:outer membrane receptor protein involved in Fe transport